MKNFLRCMPKVELHAHLNGSLDMASIRELGAALYGTNSPQYQTLGEKSKKFVGSSNLNDAFEKFHFMHELTATPKGLDLATELVVRDFANDNVIYLELRTTPKQNEHMTREQYLECVLCSMKRVRLIYPTILVKLLVSIDRSQPVSAAEETVRLACAFKKREPSLIAGIDFSGNPYKGRFADFRCVLLEARQRAGLPLVLHCGEIDNPAEIQEMIDFRMSRCGHGTFLSAADIEMLKSLQVPIECCLTSNIKTGTVSDYAQHHLERIMQAKAIAVICTDDCGVFETTLSQEFEIAANTFGLNRDACLEFTHKAIKSSFATAQEQDALTVQLDHFKNNNT